MKEQKANEPEKFIVKVPLRTAIIFLGLFITLFLFSLCGPERFLSAWLKSKEEILKAQAMKESIAIVGEENYFRSKECKSK